MSCLAFVSTQTAPNTLSRLQILVDHRLSRPTPPSELFDAGDPIGATRTFSTPLMLLPSLDRLFPVRHVPVKSN